MSCWSSYDYKLKEEDKVRKCYDVACYSQIFGKDPSKIEYVDVWILKKFKGEYCENNKLIYNRKQIKEYIALLNECNMPCHFYKEDNEKYIIRIDPEQVQSPTHLKVILTAIRYLYESCYDKIVELALDMRKKTDLEPIVCLQLPHSFHDTFGTGHSLTYYNRLFLPISQKMFNEQIMEYGTVQEVFNMYRYKKKLCSWPLLSTNKEAVKLRDSKKYKELYKYMLNQKYQVSYD